MALRRQWPAAAVVAVLLAAARGGAEVPATVTAGLDRLMRQYHEAGQFDGVVLVAQDDEVLYASAFGAANREWDVPNTLDAKFEIASITKPMTALLVLQLVDAGQVRLDAPVAEYVPHFKGTPGSGITIEQLLNHTSGLQQDMGFPERGESPDVAARLNADQLSNDELVKLIAARPLRFAPGTRFGYSSDGYAVLGAVAERVAGRPYWQLLRERILAPAGMTDTEVALSRPIVRKRVQGYRRTFTAIENGQHVGATPAGGLYSTAFDLYRWDRALYGDRLASEKTRNLLFAPRSAPTAYGWKTTEEDWGKGKHLVARTTGGLPGFTNRLSRVPALRRVVILLSNVRGPVDRLDDITLAVNRALDGLPYDAPRRSLAQALAATVRTDTSAETRARFHALRGRSDFALEEAEMNALGYELLALGEPGPAITVFRLNVESFPKSANAHDSLGEAFMLGGDRELAVESYEMVLRLDPGNANAKAMLEKLRN